MLSLKKVLSATLATLMFLLITPINANAVYSENPIDNNEEGNISNSTVYYAYACSQKGDGSGDLVVLDSKIINGKPVPIKYWFYKDGDKNKDNDKPVPSSVAKNSTTMYWEYKVDNVNSNQFKAPFLDCKAGNEDKLRVITRDSTNGEDPVICTTGFDVWRAYGTNSLEKKSDIKVWSHSRANIKSICKPNSSSRAFVPIAPHPDDSTSAPSGSVYPWRSSQTLNEIGEPYVTLNLDSAKPGTLRPITVSGNCSSLMTGVSNPLKKAFETSPAETLAMLNATSATLIKTYGPLATHMVNGQTSNGVNITSWDDNIDCSGEFDFASDETALDIAVCSTEIRERVRKFYDADGNVSIERYVDTLGGKRYNKPTQAIATTDGNQDVSGLRELIFRDIEQRSGNNIVGPPQSATDFPPSIRQGASDYTDIAAKYAGLKVGKIVKKSGKTLGIYVDESVRNFYKSNDKLVPSYLSFKDSTMYQQTMVRVYEGTKLTSYPLNSVQVISENREDAVARSKSHTVCQFAPIQLDEIDTPPPPVPPAPPVTAEAVVLDVYLPDTIQVGGSISENRKYQFKAVKGQTICRDEFGRKTPCTGGFGQTCPKGVLDSPPCLESLKFDIEITAPNYKLCQNSSDKSCDYYITPQNKNYSSSSEYIQADIQKTGWFYKATDKTGPLQVRVTDGNGGQPNATFRYAVGKDVYAWECVQEAFVPSMPIYDIVTDEFGNEQSVKVGDTDPYYICVKYDNVWKGRVWERDVVEQLPVIVNIHIQTKTGTKSPIRATSKTYPVIGSSSTR